MISDADTLRRIARAVERLDQVQREVLLLSARERLDNAQIARRLGLTVDGVRVLLADALCRIDRALERRR